MTYRVWKQWVQSLPWSLRWFVLLILLRPTLDVFYFLKDISPFLSPLYIVGVLTPFLILLSFLANTFPAKEESFLDFVLGFWGLLVLLGALTMVLDRPSIATFGDSIKHITPILIYFFVRHLIRSKQDLKGVLTTFLYGAAVPFGMLLFERLVSPLGDLVHTRGFTRYEGLYADVVSYAIYIIGAFLIACYFFLDQDSMESFKKRAWRLAIMAALCLLGLISMHHTSSWGVAAALVGLLLLHAAGSKQFSLVVFVVFIGLAGFFLVGDTINERVGTALQTEIAVLEGEKDVDRAFHGRMTRWNYYIAQWRDVMGLEGLIGANLNPNDRLGGLMGGMHNDYLRILFTTGGIGLSMYLLFYVLLFFQTISLPSDEKFLVHGAIAILLLYSITTVPTLYPSLLYLVFSVFAYGALPPEVQRLPAPHTERMPSDTFSTFSNVSG